MFIFRIRMFHKIKNPIIWSEDEPRSAFNEKTAAGEALHVQLRFAICTNAQHSHTHDDNNNKIKIHENNASLNLHKDDSEHNSSDDARSVCNSSNHQTMNGRSIGSTDTISTRIFVSRGLDKPRREDDRSALSIQSNGCLPEYFDHWQFVHPSIEWLVMHRIV